MAANATLVEAERLFVVEGQGPTEIATHFGVSRKTVYNWRDAGGWELRREEYVHKLTRDVAETTRAATVDAIVASAMAGTVWTALERRALLRAIGEAESTKPGDRIRAIQADAILDPQSQEVEGIEHSDTPTRFVIRRASDAR